MDVSYSIFLGSLDDLRASFFPGKDSKGKEGREGKGIRGYVMGWGFQAGMGRRKGKGMETKRKGREGKVGKG